MEEISKSGPHPANKQTKPAGLRIPSAPVSQTIGTPHPAAPFRRFHGRCRHCAFEKPPPSVFGGRRRIFTQNQIPGFAAHAPPADMTPTPPRRKNGLWAYSGAPRAEAGTAGVPKALRGNRCLSRIPPVCPSPQDVRRIQAIAGNTFRHSLRS